MVTVTHFPQKMVQMNMPLVDGEGSNVSFNATLFALVRTSLKIQCAGTYTMYSFRRFCVHVCTSSYAGV